MDRNTNVFWKFMSVLIISPPKTLAAFPLVLLGTGNAPKGVRPEEKDEFPT